MGEIILGDNLDVLRTLPDRAFQLIYVDPPFNTGKSQSRTRIRVTPDPDGDRTGFQGRRYRTQVVGSSAVRRRVRRLHRVPAPAHGRGVPRRWTITAASSSTLTIARCITAR